MHLMDGILSPAVTIGGCLLAGALALPGLLRLRTDDVPVTGMLAAVFFLGTFIHIPLAGSSVHLVLVGLLGIVLGWQAVPALMAALLLQALMGHGGLWSLGVNVMCFGLPALIVGALWRGWFRPGRGGSAIVLVGGILGMLAVALMTGLMATALLMSDPAYRLTATTIALGHLPIMAAEFVLTGTTVRFLSRVRPELLLPVPTSPESP